MNTSDLSDSSNPGSFGILLEDNDTVLSDEEWILLYFMQDHDTDDCFYRDKVQWYCMFFTLRAQTTK